MIHFENKTIKTITDNEQMILWDLPQGIFDPMKENENSRVSCSPSMGRTCGIDVRQYILHGSQRVSNDEVNKIDKAIVSFRNQSNLDRLATIVVPMGEKMLFCPKFEIDKECTKKHAINLKNFFYQNKERGPVEYELMEGFCNQNETLLFKKYLSDLPVKEGMKTHETFFKDTNVNPLDLIPTPILQLLDPSPKPQLKDENAFELVEKDKFLELMGKKRESMQEYPINFQYQIANIASNILVAKAYKLPASEWKPTKGIDLLFDEVKKHGVIGFGGLFGKHFYSASPHVVLKSNGHNIYGWNASERKTTITAGHYIAIVGVKKETDQKMLNEGKVGYVIYIDPVDGTDPQNPAQRKFYIVSYPTFIKNVNNEFGISTKIGPKDFQEFEDEFLKEYSSLKPFTYGLLPNPPYINK